MATSTVSGRTILPRNSGRVSYDEFEPPSNLREYVQCYYLFDITVPGKEISIVPGGGLGLVFNLGSQLMKVSGRRRERLPSVFVVGQFAEHHFWTSTGRILLFGVRFHPVASRVFSKGPVSTHTSCTPDAAKIFGSSIKSLQLGSEVEAMQAVVSRFLKDWVDDFGEWRLGPNYRMFAESLLEIVASHGNLDLDAMKEKYALSARRIEQVYKEYLGIGPKTFARIKRFHYALQQINRADELNLTKLALNSGYYDQAHFNRDFKKFMGLSPNRYVALNQRILSE